MKKGFTLIELLVVVLIIGILAAVALPQYTKAVEKSRATEAITLLGNLATAEQIYKMGQGQFTNDLTQLDLQLPGVIFRAIHYKPFYGTGKGENLQGVQIYITDTLDANLSLLQFYAMQVLAEMYPDHKAFELEGVEKRFNMFDKVCGSDQIRLRFTKNYNVADIIDYWNKDVEAFKARSVKYYLYK